MSISCCNDKVHQESNTASTKLSTPVASPSPSAFTAHARTAVLTSEPAGPIAEPSRSSWVIPTSDTVEDEHKDRRNHGNR
ncbi:hypothetical protein RRG08_066815 [Elysia crispata]|uniref:Uncharacterized protein n=1 Tax=Elysia crispata TaxID=231223 RepID=A0AAE0YA01_9GAST|nr:hypothetical protein RRG08_066815 [Elysia crispata]